MFGLRILQVSCHAWPDHAVMAPRVLSLWTITTASVPQDGPDMTVAMVCVLTFKLDIYTRYSTYYSVVTYAIFMISRHFDKTT